MRRGVRIGVDVGSRRVGVARSDPDGVLAVPVTTLTRDRHTVARLVELAREYEASEVLVGLPIGLDGREGPAAEAARAFAGELAAACAPVPVRLVDERLSTVSAQSGLRQAGRDVRSSRAVVDQAAAVVIVQHALDAERTAGAPTGEPVPTPVDSTDPTDAGTGARG